MTGLELLIAVAGLLVTVLVVAGMILITPHGAVSIPAEAADSHSSNALREQVADHDERIGRLIEALERGMEPDLIGARLAKLRAAKEEVEIELRALAPTSAEF